MKKISYCFLAMVLFTTGVSAQVTIGSGKVPESFSALEVVGNNIHGLRLPRIETTARRDEIFTNAAGFQANNLAMGLQIFNLETRCVETWNGSVWIQSCPPEGPYVPPLPPAPPITSIPAGTGTTNWATNAWVGAFWRNDQTGERIIRSTNSTPWTVTVDPEYTSWVVVDNARENATLWKDGVTPDDAELYQVSGSNTLSGNGDILFRFGLKSTNPNPVTSDFKAMNPETGDIVNSRAPRYATATLNINGTNHKLFLRQGEAADYVYRRTDLISVYEYGYSKEIARTWAAKFSPYNLTDENLSETVLSSQTAINGGKFVEFPTQAGAFWQWGTSLTRSNYTNYLRRAYHPVNPTGVPAIWDDDDYYFPGSGVWSEFTGNNRLETCPEGWRRPMDNNELSTGVANTNELLQSLFITTNENNGSDRHRYFGYYADGFFDRLPIVNSVTNDTNSAVSANTKDAAYRGLLFTNPATNASLFVPAAGYHDYYYGNLQYAGSIGQAWTSSSNANYSETSSWYLFINKSFARLGSTNHTGGFSIRCVSDN